jgi:predicted O-methyltransferase YrrM
MRVTERRMRFSILTMTQPSPQDVDAYFEATLLEPDEVLETIVRRAKKAGLPDHHVSPLQGAFLTILTRAVKAERVLEIGTLAGYSTICLARGLEKDGVIITLENDPQAIAAAEKEFKRHRYWRNIQLYKGEAINSLNNMIVHEYEPFDLIFIDADKPSNPAYLEAALKLSKPGTLIIGDNVVRDGAVADATSKDPKVQGVRTFLEAMRQNPNLLVTAMQTVGSKGHDGFSMALVV